MDIWSTSDSSLAPGYTDLMHRALPCSQLIPDSIACRLYLLTVLVETAIDIAIEADLLIRFHEVGGSAANNEVLSRKMPVYLAIFTFAQYVHTLLSIFGHG